MEFGKKWVDESIKQSCGVLADFPWEEQKFYSNWLSQMYYLVCHSTRLTALAASRFSMDEFSYHKRFIDHSIEELRHELLAQNDLKTLGFSDVKAFPESPQVQAIYMSQYYLIQNVDPLSLLGEILFLEALSITAGQNIHQRVEKKFGPKASSFLRVHVTEDESHIVEAVKLLNSVGDRIESVERSYRIVEEQYLSMCRWCGQSANASAA